MRCHACLQERLRRLNWPPVLTEEEVLRGLSYYGSGRGLHRLAAKLLAGKPVKIVAIGGSVTEWGGGDPGGVVRGCTGMTAPCAVCRWGSARAALHVR